MIEETYKIKWKSFDEEIPEPYKVILVRKPKETLKDAQWHFVNNDKKKLYLHTMKFHWSISRIKTWLWCYDKDLEKIE